MAIAPSYMRRKPLSSMLDFAEERAREAASIGDVITKLAQPTLTSMGAVPEPAVQRGPAPVPQKLGTMTGPAMAPTLVDAREQPGLQPDITTALTNLESAYGAPLNVTSGYRDPVKNDAVGGAKGSQHLSGGAVDVDVSGMPIAERQRLIQEAQNQGFTGIGVYDNSLHFDMGPTRAWGPSYGRESVPDWAVGLVGGGGGGGLTVSTKGGPAGAPQNVEDILGSLYPVTSPEDEKRLRRKDFLAAAGQGLSALSQGGTVDFTNIRQAAEARRQQGVQDMRERERARAAASLVYSQTGDAEMAGAIASGAIQYGDVVSERERQRVERDADLAKVKQAQASGTLAQVYADVLPTLGISDAASKTIVDGIASGMDPAVLLAPNQLAKVADEARKNEEAVADAAALRESAIASFMASGDPVKQRAGEYLSLSDMSVQEAMKLATDELGTAAEDYTLSPGQTRFGAGGQVVASLPAAAGTPETFTLGPGETRFGAGGEVVASLPAAPVVPEQYAPSEIQSTWDASRTAAAARGPEALAQFEAQYPTAADLQMAISGKLGGVPSQVDALNADLMSQGLLVTPDPANPSLPLVENGQIVTTEIEGGPAQVKRLQLEQEQAKTDAERTALEEKATLTEQKAAIDNESSMRLLSDVYDQAESFAGGAIPGKVREIIANILPASEAGQAQGQLAGVKVDIFLDELATMRKNSPTGAALGNVTEGEREALGNKYGTLQIGGDPEVLKQNLRAIANASLDMQHGTPAAIRALVEAGEITAEVAERYGARYDIDGTAETTLTGKLGKVVPLGLTTVDETILTDPVAPEEAAVEVSPDSPDPEYEATLLQNPDLITEMTFEQYQKLSPKQKEVIDRLAEGNAP